ncbi:MAG TPA: hypothetical protein VGJ83_04025 [Gemmatimonadales bacterium]|jgi:hypothetical protein
MKRIAIALALVAMASAACKKADQAQTSDTTHMMADSTKMAGDTTHMMAPDSAKKH